MAFRGIKRKIEGKKTVKPAKPAVKVVDIQKRLILLDGEKRVVTLELCNWLMEHYFNPHVMMDITSYLTRLAKIEHDHRVQKKWDKQIILHSTRRTQSMKDADFDLVLKTKLEHGYNPKRIQPIVEEIENEQARIAEEKHKKQLKGEAEEKARQRFSNVYQRIVGYVKLDQYRNELENKAKDATMEELLSCEQWTYKTDKLTPDQRNLALAWIQGQIREKQGTQTNANEDPSSLLKKVVQSFRGH